MRDRIVEYYQRKTDFIIEKYGVGNRVHFHMGYFAPPAPAVPVTLSEISLGMARAQDHLLRVAFGRWSEYSNLNGNILDVGCGLGGTSIWLAEQFGSAVTALTNIPTHFPIVAEFAESAGVGGRVRVQFGDAHTFVGGKYDVAVAIESSCYLDLDRWFGRLCELVRPGGHVLVEDVTFVGSSRRWKNSIDEYWKIDSAPVQDLLGAAVGHGFQLVDRVDITENVLPFVDWTIAWSRARSQASNSDARRLGISIREHRRFKDALLGNGVQAQLLAFQREQ
ncbi:SAM-dependent methyltransferase [Streptomyces vinaceus]|uniref:SAM-dependent methyltransferase n=1 Tax=Streptomyces vinaceus TaxID=1960 RepID=UPI00367A5FD1